MKGILVGTLLALPLAISSLPSQASAAEIIVRPNVYRYGIVHRPVFARFERRFIPAHWETIRRGNRWVKVRVPAGYVNVI